MTRDEYAIVGCLALHGERTSEFVKEATRIPDAVDLIVGLSARGTINRRLVTTDIRGALLASRYKKFLFSLKPPFEKE
jgi:hypothetical protein